MLVVDTSSSCDICLDPYNWKDPERVPHLISCGHIFCRRCLHRVVPMKCPLCRKMFSFSDISRLLAEPMSEMRVEPEETPVERQEEIDKKRKYSLMRKLVLLCDSEEEDIAAVRKEVDSWLCEAPDEGHCPLRKTVEILDRLQHARDRKKRDKREIKHLRKSLSIWKAFAEQNSPSVMEEKYQDLINRYQQEVNQLRAELELSRQHGNPHGKPRRHKSTNPLPIPPQSATYSEPAEFRDLRQTLEDLHINEKNQRHRPKPPRAATYPTPAIWNQNVNIRRDKQPHPVYDNLDYCERRPYSPLRPSRLSREIFASDDEAAYFTCPTGTRSLWLDEEDEVLYQGVGRNY
ncbi:hypothetical protein VKT23_011541 [Stygiomarasmius scandens]|uniref:RING-type domain-containing protein n=1 Tax=Marasmiellus scandens TaxID=2682957 RepID=A0ABR1JD76_9AGAR